MPIHFNYKFNGEEKHMEIEKMNKGKNFKLNYEGFEEYMIDDTPHSELGGAHYIFKFQNGYGASVIKHLGSYGFSEDLWEIGLIWFFSPIEKMHNQDGWNLVYIKELGFDDVIGYLTDEEVRSYLKKIKEYTEV